MKSFLPNNVDWRCAGTDSVHMFIITLDMSHDSSTIWHIYIHFAASNVICCMQKLCRMLLNHYVIFHTLFMKD